MRIYTRTGDAGETGLYGGQRVAKDDLRVEAYGTVDEASAALGLAAAHLGDSELAGRILGLQGDLFIVGADLATPRGRGEEIIPRVQPALVDALEAQIDAYEAELEPLRRFIVPGGTEAAAALHLARGIVRRAERRVVTLLRASPDGTNPATLRYLNRLADLLFVLARVANRRAGVDDIPWRRPDE